MKQFLSICTLTVMFLGACTQVALAQSPNVLDGAYVKETNLTKRVVPYPHLREADVMYKRRIWQEIDLRQKFNHTFYFPLDPIQDRKNLFDVIREAEPQKIRQLLRSSCAAGQNFDSLTTLANNCLTHLVLNQLRESFC